MRSLALAASLALAGCATYPDGAEPPFAATFAEAIPDMIILAAGSDGTLRLRGGCVLWRADHGPSPRPTLIPIFEPGVTTGVDARGAWLRDPGTEKLFRDGDRVSAAGAGPNDRSIAEIEAVRPLSAPVPDRCLSLVSHANPIQIGPPLHHGHLSERRR